MKDYYKILGVTESSSQDDIKKAYRNLAKVHHPDKGGNEETFKEIAEAFEIIGNPEKRKNYDLSRKGGSPRQSDFNGFNDPDFNMGFGNSCSHRWFRGFEKKSKEPEYLDRLIRREVNLSDLIKGIDVPITFTRTVINESELKQSVEESITLKINLRENWQPINIINIDGTEIYRIRFFLKGMGDERTVEGIKYTGNLTIDIIFKTDETIWMEPDGTIYHVLSCSASEILTNAPILVEACTGEKFRVKSYDTSNLSRIKFTIRDKGIKLPNGSISNYVFLVQPNGLNIKNLSETELESLKSLLKKCE